MPISLRSKGRLVGVGEVDALESRLRILFPADYHHFLLAYNVAIPDPNQFVNATVTMAAELFFGVSNIALDDLFEQNRVVYAGRLPKDVLAVARASGGNLLCLSLPDGSVYFWDHEKEASDNQAPGFGNLTKLAASLPAFLEALQPRTMESPEDAKVTSVQLKPGFAEKFKKYM